MTRQVQVLITVLGAVLLPFSASGAQSAATAAAPRIAYINSELIIQQAPGRAAMEAQFEKEMTPIRERLKAINDSNALVLRKYEDERSILTAEARTARETQIGEKQRSWQIQVDSLNRLAATRGSEIEAPMAELLKKVLAEVRQEDGYWMILDVAAEGGLGIVAIDRNMDITDRILARFRTAAGTLTTPAAAAPPGGGPVNSPPGVGVKIPPPL